MLNLRSKARRRLLAYFFTNPAARLYLREIAAKLGVDAANLSRELRRLEGEGLFLAETSGHQKYFRLNPGYPLYKEIGRIVAKTIGVVPTISAALRKMDGIEEAHLYGSFARNQQDAGSDVDIFLIGEPEGKALAQTIRTLEGSLGREINYTVMTRKEFSLRRARGDAFVRDVWRNKRIPLTSEGRWQD